MSKRADCGNLRVADGPRASGMPHDISRPKALPIDNDQVSQTRLSETERSVRPNCPEPKKSNAFSCKYFGIRTRPELQDLQIGERHLDRLSHYPLFTLLHHQHEHFLTKFTIPDEHKDSAFSVLLDSPIAAIEIIPLT